MSPPSVLHTPGFAHYNIAWSPFHPTRLAVASAANYGLIGNGRLHLVSLSASPSPSSLPSPVCEKWYPTQDGLYDVAWSEVHENQLVSASGDGSLRLWDVTLNDLPIRIWTEHTREVYSVDWSNTSKDTFCSASWDGTVKIWTPDRAHSLTTIHAALGCIYQALFSPHHPSLLASASSDGALRIFDLRSPALMNAPTSLTKPVTAPALVVPPRGSIGFEGGMEGVAELLTLDWNKYRPLVLAAAGTDKVVRVWDCRMLNAPTSSSPSLSSLVGASAAAAGPETTQIGGALELELAGHEYAVRKVQWSPHRPDVLASASYDMTCRVWTTNPLPTPPAPGLPSPSPFLTHINDSHNEFVVGCAWSLYDQGLLASCGWDGRACLMRV